MRTKLALYCAWFFSTTAFFAHIGAMVALMTDRPLMGLDGST